MVNPIDTLYEQHRRMFALLDLLKREITVFARGGPFDPYVVEGALEYIAEYPDRLHRPIELLVYDAYRRRQGGEDPLATAAAANEHEDLSAHARELRNAIVAASRNTMFPRDVVATSAHRLIDGLSRHMQHEEDTILPAARAALTEDDLAAVRATIERNPEAPSLAAEEKAFARLFGTLAAQEKLGLVTTPGKT